MIKKVFKILILSFLFSIAHLLYLFIRTDLLCFYLESDIYKIIDKIFTIIDDNKRGRYY